MKRLSSILAAVTLPMAWAAEAPLPSWKESTAKTAVVDFVRRVTTAGSPDFVPPAQRIAVFDNDGTLWAEKPMYFQALFLLNRIQAIALQHPEWKDREPFASVLKGDTKAAFAGGEKALLEMAMATHAGMSTERFESIVRSWMEKARHPESGRPYTEMVYQPMLELLAYLRAEGFKTFIVSGGGIEFMRPWAEATYGIPPEQIIGSSIRTRYELQNGKPVIVKLPEINFIDDKAGKPVAIQHHIGRRPLMAFGNSDGDFEMLEWTTAGEGPRFAAFIHHDDPEREYAYDRESHVGKLAKGLDEAPKRGWTIVSMKNDWDVIYPAPNPE